MANLRNNVLPFAEPSRSSRRLRGSELQFLSQPNQIVCDVDVIKWFRKADGEFKRLGARQQSVKRAPRSHAITLEERRVSSLCANQIVTSVVGWPHHQVMPCEHLKRGVQNRGREMWTVAIESDHVLPVGGCEVSKDRGESCGETFAFLRNNRNGAA